MPSFESRLRGGLYGLLIGDALGVPYEFKRASQIPPLEQIELTPPPGYRSSYPNIPAGTWSDDGAQALALLDSLLNCGQLDLNDFARNIAEWDVKGNFAGLREGFEAIPNRWAEGLRGQEIVTPLLERLLEWHS